MPTRAPDFLFTLNNSAEFVPVLVEIEVPSKKWFTQKGEVHSDLTHAMGQLTEWKAWLAVPSNRTTFVDLYSANDQERARSLRPHYALVHGNRAEFENKDYLNRLRHYYQPQESSLMSFDRLSLSSAGSRTATVRIRPPGEREVVSLPPTFLLGPYSADLTFRARGIEDAIDRMELISEARRDFLKSRVPYWRKWWRGIEAGEMFAVSGVDGE
jgi:hypothetical protein